jgi:hypothetical protein
MAATAIQAARQRFDTARQVGLQLDCYRKALA